MSRIRDIDNWHERTKIGKSIMKTRHFWQDSARTHESPCPVAEGKFDARCTCEQKASREQYLTEMVRIGEEIMQDSDDGASINYPTERLTEGMSQAFESYGYDRNELIKLIRDVELYERMRIISNIKDRIDDLRACSKRDNCQELANLIESYIPEWTELR